MQATPISSASPWTAPRAWADAASERIPLRPGEADPYGSAGTEAFTVSRRHRGRMALDDTDSKLTPIGNACRVFFGWQVVAAAFTVAVFAWGIGFYGPPIFLQTLHVSRGWPVSLISAAITTHFLLGAIVVANLASLHRRWSTGGDARRRDLDCARAARLGPGERTVAVVCRHAAQRRRLGDGQRCSAECDGLAVVHPASTGRAVDGVQRREHGRSHLLALVGRADRQPRLCVGRRSHCTGRNHHGLAAGWAPLRSQPG